MTSAPPPGPPPVPSLPHQPVNPDPRRGRGATVVAVVVVVIVVVAVAATIGALAGRSSDAPAPTPPAGAGAAGTAATDPVPLGTTVTPAKGWSVQVTGAELDGDATMKAENVFASPNSGKRFVVVSLAVTNGGDRAGSLAANVRLRLRSPGGVATDASWARPPNQLDIGAELQPGATLRGNLAFEVPADDADGSVLLAEPVFTLTPDQDQRFLALR